MRRHHNSDFEQGLVLFHEGKLDEAGELFCRVLSLYPHDEAARVYASQCQMTDKSDE